jgi:hypothetical protein
MRHTVHFYFSRSVQGLLMGLALLIALAPTQTFAAEPLQGNNVTVSRNQIINDDLYAFGGTVTIQGRVNGDVVALGGTVTVNGPVSGDVLIGGGTVNVSGRVGRSVRATGGTVTIDAPVGTDVAVAGGTVTLGSGARVGRDVLANAGSTTVDGRVGRNVRMGGGTLRLDDGAVVGGNLIYTSNQQAAIATGATVRGTIQRYAPQRMGFWPAAGLFGRTGDSVVSWLRTLIGLFVLGLLFILLAPRFGRRTVGTLGGSPWASLGLGIALLICVPIAALIVFVVGLFVGGWWLALILLALYGIALVLSIAVTGLFLGRWILERVGRGPVPLVWALLLGLVLLLLVSLVPVAGGLVTAVAMFCGLGALALTVIRSSGTPPAAADRVDRAPALSGSTG